MLLLNIVCLIDVSVGTLMNDQSILSYLRKLAAEDVEEECSQ